MDFPGGSAGKESTCNAGDIGSVPGLERSPGEFHGLYTAWGRKESYTTEWLSLSLLLLILHYASCTIFSVVLIALLNKFTINSQISVKFLTDSSNKSGLMLWTSLFFSHWVIDLIHSYHLQDLKVRENWRDIQLNKHVFACYTVSSMSAPCTFSIIYSKVHSHNFLSLSQLAMM